MLKAASLCAPVRTCVCRCVFTDPEQTFDSFYTELTNPLNAKRTYGGYVRDIACFAA